MDNVAGRSEKIIIGSVPVLAALLGNLIIAVIKFIGFFLSGSSVLFSEAIHSVADTANQALLIIGIRRSVKKPDERFIYGYGKERFLWALISACGIFFLGAGASIYRGVESLARGHGIVISPVIYVILAVSFAVEAATFILALVEFNRHGGKEASLRELFEGGDPATLAVIFEDGVALLSILVAFFSIFLASFTGKLYWDAIGSIIIGVFLGIAAVILVNKNREFLIEKSIPDEFKEKIIEILEADPLIEKVLDFKSSSLDIGVYRIKCEVEFNGSMLLRDIQKNPSLKEEYELVRSDYREFIRFCADYLDRVPRLLGEKINKLEEKIQKEVPGIKHIDIEIN